MRSLLFVPGDSRKKLDRALTSGADALIIDLEDSVAPESKGEARRVALDFLRELQRVADRPRLLVRINSMSTPFSEGDLDIVMTAAPDAIVLPKAGGGADVMLLDARLAVREALHALPDRSTGIVAIVTETPAAVFTCGTYAGCSPRLLGLTWGAEDLSAEIGAVQTRKNDRNWTEPFGLVRSLCLFGASAAGVASIDTVYTDFRDEGGLRRECEEAARDGFTAKLAIHPAQVGPINEAFTPGAEAIAQAERVIAAMQQAGSSGVASLDGKMLDRPHLKAAERLLSRAGPPPDRNR